MKINSGLATHNTLFLGEREKEGLIETVECGGQFQFVIENYGIRLLDDGEE